jgi:hypothetical protein
MEGSHCYCAASPGTVYGKECQGNVSYLNDLYPDVAMSQNTVGSFMAKLERRDEMVDFIYVKEGQKLIFDDEHLHFLLRYLRQAGLQYSSQ